MRFITCNLTFNEDGSVAELRATKNGLLVARLGVRGPFKRNAEEVSKGYDTPFFGELHGIADYQYISNRGETENKA